MDVIRHLRRQFDYDRWANLQTLPRASSGRPARIMAHIVAVQGLYLSRLRQDGEVVEVWPEAEPIQLEPQLISLHAAWDEYLKGLRFEDLEVPIPYVNSAGETWSSPVIDMLTHIPYHGAYHRGQIASLLSGDPPYADYIEAARRGQI